MPHHCVALGCSNIGKSEGISFHSFPADKDLRRKWIDAVKRKDWEPSKHSKLCSAHFREKDIDRTSLSCVRIREGVVPVIFPDATQVRGRSKKKLDRPGESHAGKQGGCRESPTKKLKTELNQVKSHLETQERRVKSLLQNERRLSRKVARLEDIVQSLKTKVNTQEETCSLLTSNIEKTPITNLRKT